jgi:hypothetical protein
MSRILCTTLAAVGLLTVAASAWADDSSASIGAGGISFAKSADIRMASEDLSVSPERIRVRFTFVNDSARDIDTVIAFPLPDIDTTEYWYSPLGSTTDDPVNFVGFKVLVNGSPISFEADQRAIAGGRDITAAVRAAGIPVNVVMGQRFGALDKLSKNARRALAAVKAVELEEDNVVPRWTIRTRFHWKQHFPAGKTVTIEHSYQPVTGTAFFTKYEMAAKGKDDYWKQRFCMDPPTLSRIHRMLAEATARPKSEGMDGMLQISTTEYVLSTGNNWKGPIGRFHMTLDKLKPENTLSVCWDGLKKTGPNTFEFARTNYAPDRDVRMVVLR